MKRPRLPLSLLFVGLMSVTHPLLAQESTEAVSRSFAVTAPDPAVQVRETVRLLRNNDLAGLVRAMIPPAQYQLALAAWEKHRAKPATPVERTEFAEKLAKLTAPDAVDVLMAEIEPKLVEHRPEAAGAVMMGLGAIHMALSSAESDLSEDQRASLQQAFPGVQRWATSTDFLSSLSMRQALTVLTAAVRNTGVDTLDELKAMPFDQVLAKAGSMLAASKDALVIYGLDVDAIADSVQVQVISNDGQTARVRTTVTLFDAPISAEHELVLQDGRWYGKHAAGKWSIHDHDESKG